MTIHYRSVAEAKDLRGLRLALTIGVPGPWSEAAKSIFHVKGLSYVPVAQYAGMPNEDLVAWTGHNNAPVAVYDGEVPRTTWTEILFLAEGLAPEPRLLPDDAADRALMLGLSQEICGENGFGWSRRLTLIEPLMAPGVPEAARRSGEVLGARYGYSKEAAAAATDRVVAVLKLLSSQLARQKQTGREFLVGNALSAVDIHWATFAVLLNPLDEALCPMPDYLRSWYTNVSPEIAAAIDPALMAHRDRIYRNYLQLPMSF